MRKILSFAFFIAACVAIGALSSFANTPGDWYQSLQKPFFQPPDWIFAPVWAGLYVMIGIALATTWFDENNKPRLIVFAIQAILNISWSPAFFGLKNPMLGLFIIVPLLISILAFIGMSWRPNRQAALLFVPYALWVAFAAALNLSIVVLN
jgi:tryptophan-rich sensory protein